jgi:hypothetical protein
VKASGALEGTYTGDPGNKSKTWGATVRKGYRKAKPYFEVTIPIDKVDMSQPIEDKAIEINTTFKVAYPASSGTGGFSDHSQTMEHRFWLIPLSPAEIEEYKAVRQDYRISKGLPTCLTGLGISLLIGLVLIGGPLLLARRIGIE